MGVITNSEESPQCILCLDIPAAGSVNPNKLKCHLETKNSEMQNKPEEYFRRKLDKIRIQQNNFGFHPKPC
jgi:hypothetical protein